jgi:hypothetical protein
MRKAQLIFPVFFVFSLYGTAGAVTTHTYRMIQDSIFFLVSLGCLILAISVFFSLKGGSLGKAWLFFVIGFAIALVGAIIHFLDVFRIVLHVYDMRLATLLTTCGSMILLLLGLYFYKRGLE